VCVQDTGATGSFSPQVSGAGGYEKPPKWMYGGCGAVCGFGGRMAVFGGKFSRVFVKEMPAEDVAGR